MTDFTIIEPGFEFIPPAEHGKELEFLELCTRVCYKSEDKIAPGSAEKLMNKVVREYEHYSVTEHQRVIFQFDFWKSSARTDELVFENSPLMRMTYRDNGQALLSGNLRMWLDLFKNLDALYPYEYDSFFKEMKGIFARSFPIFGLKVEPIEPSGFVHILDSNPLTNLDQLDQEEMLAHMSLTYKLIGSRSMSHQLVRHRKMSFSQESQRYCNYGKKGFQFIIPPSIPEQYRSQFITEAVASYEAYNRMIAYGIPPEDARELLPNATKTEVVTSGTLENWMHIFKHRAENMKAQWQIKDITTGIKKHMQGILPQLF